MDIRKGGSNILLKVGNNGVGVHNILMDIRDNHMGVYQKFSLETDDQ